MRLRKSLGKSEANLQQRTQLGSPYIIQLVPEMSDQAPPKDASVDPSQTSTIQKLEKIVVILIVTQRLDDDGKG